MSDDEIRILFFAQSWPTFARLPEFNSYDRAVAEQLYANLTAAPDTKSDKEDDLEYLSSVEKEIETEDDKYQQSWGE